MRAVISKLASADPEAAAKVLDALDFDDRGSRQRYRPA